MGPDMPAVPNNQSENDDTAKCYVYRRVEAPMKGIVIPENFGPLFDTSTILEGEHECGCGTFPDKLDRYFCATTSSELRDTGLIVRPTVLPFK